MNLAVSLLTAGATLAEQPKPPLEPVSNNELHRAAREGRLDAVRQMLERDPAAVNMVDSLGQAPLHAAIEGRKLEVVKLLLDKGADTNIKTVHQQDTPLHLALYRREREIAILLLDNAADATAVNKKGIYPLIWAGMQAMPDIIEKLQAKGAQFNKKDGTTSEMLYSMANACPPATAQEFKKTVDILVASGGDVNFKGSTGRAPLFALVYSSPWSSKSGKERIGLADALVAHDADVNARNKDGVTPLIWAASRGNKDVVEWLLQHGADIKAKETTRGWTALHLAAINRQKEVVELLLEKGADTKILDAEGLTPLGAALKYKSIETAAILERKMKKEKIK